MARQQIIPTCEIHHINLQWHKGLGWKCPKCLAERYADTRPVAHDDSEEATDQVLRDMAVTDAMDEFDDD